MALNPSDLIPRDSLTPIGRVKRVPLRPWAAGLLDKLRQLDGGNEYDFSDLASVQNNAALIETWRGRPLSAMELCERELVWFRQLNDAHGLLTCGEMALQPWVNVGRLLRLAGDYEGALRHFSMLPDMTEGRPFQIRGIRFNPAAYGPLLQRPVFVSFLQSVYVGDSVRTILAARDAKRAEQFLRDARPLFGDAPSVLFLEMATVVSMTLGRFDEALDWLGSAEWGVSGYTKLVRSTYRIAISIMVDKHDGVAHQVESLCDNVLRAKLESSKDTAILACLHYLGVLVLHLRFGTMAERVLRRGLRGARYFSDVPFEVSFLETLMPLVDSEERAALTAERDNLLRTSLYVPMLKARGIAVDEDAVADPVFADLRRNLEIVLTPPRQPSVRVRDDGALSTHINHR